MAHRDIGGDAPPKGAASPNVPRLGTHVPSNRSSGSRRYPPWIDPFASFIVAVALLLGPSTLRAGKVSPAAKCAASKPTATGKKVSDETKCQKALRAGTAVAPACLTKAEQKYAAAYAKAQDTGACLDDGNAAALRARCDPRCGL